MRPEALAIDVTIPTFVCTGSRAYALRRLVAGSTCDVTHVRSVQIEKLIDPPMREAPCLLPNHAPLLRNRSHVPVVQDLLPVHPVHVDIGERHVAPEDV